MTSTKKGTKREGKKLKLKKATLKDLDARKMKQIKGGGAPWPCTAFVTGCIPIKQK
jgi:natural product precursor